MLSSVYRLSLVNIIRDTESEIFNLKPEVINIISTTKTSFNYELVNFH